MPKSVQAARQLCSLCTSKVVLKILPGRLQQYMDQELPDAQTGKLGLEKAEEPEIKLPTFVGSWRKQGNFRKTSTLASLTMLKPLCESQKHCGKFLNR